MRYGNGIFLNPNNRVSAYFLYKHNKRCHKHDLTEQKQKKGQLIVTYTSLYAFSTLASSYFYIIRVPLQILLWFSHDTLNKSRNIPTPRYVVSVLSSCSAMQFAAVASVQFQKHRKMFNSVNKELIHQLMCIHVIYWQKLSWSYVLGNATGFDQQSFVVLYLDLTSHYHKFILNNWYRYLHSDKSTGT